MTSVYDAREPEAFGTFALPRLVGTPKQLTQARGLRLRCVAWTPRLWPALHHMTRARDWLAHRDAGPWGTCRVAIGRWRDHGDVGHDVVAAAVGGALADLAHEACRLMGEVEDWVIEEGPRHAYRTADYLRDNRVLDDAGRDAVRAARAGGYDTPSAVEVLLRVPTPVLVLPGTAFDRAWRARWTARLAAGDVVRVAKLTTSAPGRTFDLRGEFEEIPAGPIDATMW